jgi:Fe2+ or Zn2+ uptake regulation protein
MRDEKIRDEIESLLLLLKQSGLKRTPIRIKILQIFKNTKRPLTSAQVWDHARKLKGVKSTPMDRATMFRNLKTLVESELINATEFGTGVSYYCLKGKSEHHHHVFCTSCENTSSLSICAVGPMIDQAGKMGFLVMEHRLELLGLCADCR